MKRGSEKIRNSVDKIFDRVNPHCKSCDKLLYILEDAVAEMEYLERVNDQLRGFMNETSQSSQALVGEIISLSLGKFRESEE